MQFATSQRQQNSIQKSPAKKKTKLKQKEHVQGPCWKSKYRLNREMDKEGEDGDGGIQNQNLKPNRDQSRGSTRGRSCKGCLYYSSVQKSKSKYPTCVGFYTTLNQGPIFSTSKFIDFSCNGSSYFAYLRMMPCFSKFIDSKAFSIFEHTICNLNGPKL